MPLPHTAALSPTITVTLSALCDRFAVRNDARYCATPAGAVNNCDVMARRFAAACRRVGLTADVVQIRGPLGLYPDAHLRYVGRLERASTLAAAARLHRVQHYVTRVTDPATGAAVTFDWTFRQFLPSADQPQVAVMATDAAAPLVLPADLSESLSGTARWEVVGQAEFSTLDDLALWSAKLRHRGRRDA